MSSVRSESPQLSLIVTTLDEAGSLPALLDSIASQTRPPDEVVVVDGGSRDGTWEMLEIWAIGRPNAIVVRAPGTNIAAGRNLAVTQAHGAIIAATDAGVTLDRHWLERLVDLLETHPDLDVASGFFVAAPTSAFELALGATVLPHLPDVDPARFLPSSRSIAFRRTAWERVGGYPAWLDYCEDLVFDLALQRAGCRFTWVPGAVVYFRPRPTLSAFFTQYFRYARGDGKADLWRRRHAIRYGTYCVGLPLLWHWRRQPLALAATLASALFYLHRPVQRLLAMPDGAPHTQGHASHVGQGLVPCRNGRSQKTGVGAAGDKPLPYDGNRYSRSALLVALALIPLIRFVGDLAKMLGYPAGVLWRLRRRPGLVP